MKLLIQRLQNRLAASVVVLLVASCGGVGQDGTGATPDTRTTGVVTGFGSVIVNGIRFDTANASISVDGTAGRSQDDLRVGMVVDVTGNVAADGSTGTATSVVFESVLRGNIDEAPLARSFKVLGQTVRFDDATVTDAGLDSRELRAGDRLLVSGLRAPDGTLRATWMARGASADDIQLTGLVAAVSGAATTMRVGGLDISLAGATFEGVTAATLAPGQLVRVALRAPPVAGVAAASLVRLIDLQLPESLRRLQIQGFVSQWDAAAGRLTLNGRTVQVGATTQFQDGTVADLAVGARIQVSGTLTSERVLNAERIRIEGLPITGYVRGKVTSINLVDRGFRVLDDVAGVEVRLRTESLLDGTSTGLLSLSNLQVGDEVLVVGRAIGSRIDAVLVQRLPRLLVGAGVGGLLSAVSGTTLTVLGVSVATAGASFFDADGAAQSPAAFLAELRTGDDVRAEGSYGSAGLTASTVRRGR
jgi:hypothetical protein